MLEHKVQQSEMSVFKYKRNGEMHEVEMFKHILNKGELWKFNINKLPPKEVQYLILGALIQDAMEVGLNPVLKTDMRKSVSQLNLPVLFLNFVE